MPHPFESPFVTAGMAMVALAVAAGFVLLIWRATRSARTTVVAAIVVASLLALQFVVASAGVLQHWERKPPPFMLMVLGMLLLTACVAFSRFGTTLTQNLSFAVLVGSQGFRLPLELIMHRAARAGVMPEQMTYTGRNFDILTGTFALILCVLLARHRAGTGAIRIWNALGLCLLINVVAIAVVSLPNLQLFGNGRVNDWIAYAPFVWLPGILVPSALLGHLLVWRKLRLSKMNTNRAPRNM